MTDLTQMEKMIHAIEELTKAVNSLGNEPKLPAIELGAADAYFWNEDNGSLIAIENVSRVSLHLLKGIGPQAEQLLANTLQFARGHGANNVLLWGARGMGKSSLVKALHAEILSRNDPSLKRLVLVEINREDIASLPRLMRLVSSLPARFILFCDDLSFDPGETDYKALKTILDGGLEGRPRNTLFYATSNRRHLMARDMIDNERSTAINPGEAVHEKISLSDRFGLWLGFHNCTQDEFLEMVRGYASYHGIELADNTLVARAIEWSNTRGARSGRVAVQFVTQLAGEMGIAV